MKAVILVGGEGTRMRPLTETTPKPLLPLVDRPGLDHVLDHLARHGVHEVVLSSPYLEATFHPFIESRHGDPAITWIVEDEPLGTGGAIVHALAALGDAPFFALNGDILTDLDLTEMATFHRERSAAVTIALHHVDDARAFGLVETDERARVLAFREKPTELMPGDVNAGTYLIDPAVLRTWTSDHEISIEREIFPRVIADGHAVVGFPARAYWMDLGTPEKYLQAHFDLLEGKVRGVGYPAPWIAADADVEVRAHLGRWVAVGPGARVAADAQVDDSVLLPGSSVGDAARVLRSILGPGAHVGARATVVDCVLGAGAEAPDGIELEGAKVPTDATAGTD
ncbi:MAG: sugar phosphate nucleotidyltransferase [Actinomycetota bacterium]